MSGLRRAPDLIRAAPAVVRSPPKAALPFYHSPEWLALRRRVIALRGAWCEACGRAGRLHLDHVVEMRDGGAMLDEGNVQLLCQPCHNRKTEREKARRVAGGAGRGRKRGGG